MGRVVSAVLLLINFTVSSSSYGNPCRQHYTEDIEAAINKQINFHLYMSYVYETMSNYFQRCDVSLPGFSKFFLERARAHHIAAEIFVEYQTTRGGVCVFLSIKGPDNVEWDNGRDAMQTALDNEKQASDLFFDLYVLALTHNDGHVANFILNKFMNPQMDLIYKICHYVTTLNRVGSGLGEYIFDRHMGYEDISFTK